MPEQPEIESVKSEILCRICLAETDEPIISPCYCKGTMGYVHISCVEHWLSEAGRDTCELCSFKYETECVVHYKFGKSVYVWLCKDQKTRGHINRGVWADVGIAVVVTPIIFGAVYFCVLAADHYYKDTAANLAPAKFTTFMLLLMVAIIALGYYLWMHLAVLYHIKNWYTWWQSQVTVRIACHAKTDSNLETHHHDILTEPSCHSHSTHHHDVLTEPPCHSHSVPQNSRDLALTTV